MKRILRALAPLVLTVLALASARAADPYAKAVVAAEILGGGGNSQADPARALGAPDDAELSMGGPGAWVILDMGADSPVTDGPGPDLEVREIGAAFGGADESYLVLVSNSPETNSFVLVGEGRALSLLDIGPSGLGSARYVWLQDLATETLGTSTPGSDIDSVRSLHFSGGDATVPPPTDLAVRLTGQGAWLSWKASAATNLTRYAIRRSLDGVSFGSTPDAYVDAGGTAWQDLDVPAVRGITYAVSALAGSVESVLSIVTLPAAEIPVTAGPAVHLGDDVVEAWEDPSPDPALEVEVVLPVAAAGPRAELAFDAFGIDFSSNALVVNGGQVATLPTQSSESWAARTVSFAAGSLLPGRNTLRISPRTSGGGTNGELDDFQVRNLVLRIFGDTSRIELLTSVRFTRVAADAGTVTLRWVVEQTPSLSPVDWRVVSGPVEWTGALTPDQGYFRLSDAP